jgi:NCAIR mutase (PurE)-related protein
MEEKLEDLGFACVDLSREERCGRGEVIFAEGKTAPQVLQIATVLHEHHGRFLATRVSREQAALVTQKFSGMVHHEAARCLSLGGAPSMAPLVCGVVAAGTSDTPVQEEAAVTLEFYGWKVKRITDVGVAGLHRLLRRVEELRECHALVVVAGMEGTLPSVVGGLVSCPVVAVPTSVGYGVHLQGLAPLLAMLTSCASGISVVNVDNGFGAAAAVDRIFQSMVKTSQG